jgi:ABC-2 type transport system permease protein
MGERIGRMLVKEFIQALRDPRMRVVVFVMPIIQMLVIGYAVTTDVKHVRTAIRDQDNTPASREIISRFLGSGYFDLVDYTENDARGTWLIDHGRIDVLIRIDRGFDEDLRAGRVPQIQLILDGTDSNTASIVGSYANRITQAFARQVLIERVIRLQGSLRRPGRPDLRTRAWFNENLESRNFYVPGVIMIVVSVITLLLTSMAIVREKEIGTMEQLMVTPIRPIEFILGKTLPFALIG